MYHLSTFHLLKIEDVNRRLAGVSPKNHFKNTSNYQDLDLNII